MFASARCRNGERLEEVLSARREPDVLELVADEPPGRESARRTRAPAFELWRRQRAHDAHQFSAIDARPRIGGCSCGFLLSVRTEASRRLCDGSAGERRHECGTSYHTSERPLDAGRAG